FEDAGRALPHESTEVRQLPRVDERPEETPRRPVEPEDDDGRMPDRIPAVVGGMRTVRTRDGAERDPRTDRCRHDREPDRKGAQPRRIAPAQPRTHEAAAKDVDADE